MVAKFCCREVSLLESQAGRAGFEIEGVSGIGLVQHWLPALITAADAAVSFTCSVCSTVSRCV